MAGAGQAPSTMELTNRQRSILVALASERKREGPRGVLRLFAELFQHEVADEGTDSSGYGVDKPVHGVAAASGGEYLMELVGDAVHA